MNRYMVLCIRNNRFMINWDSSLYLDSCNEL